MRKKLPKILITGGAGFIGSAFVTLCLNQGFKVVVVDNLTYAGDLTRIKTQKKDFSWYKANICNQEVTSRIFKKETPEFVVHFAAETHVDRSIQSAAPFIQTNIEGTRVLLDNSRKFKVKKFVYISTDEIYGEIKKGSFNEESRFNPGNPYSVSKAAADFLVSSYVRTYGFPGLIVRPTNNYGPWQYPEKFVTLTILKALRNQKIPIYGEGKNKREWLYVDDSARGILKVLNEGKIGQAYNLGGAKEKRNIDVAKKILKVLGKSDKLLWFVKDRPGHDFRYSLDSAKINRLGWSVETDFECGIKKTIDWCKINFSWLDRKAKDLEGYWKKVYKKS